MKPVYLRETHPWFGDEPFLTASFFSGMLFVSRYLEGGGGQWLDYVDRFIERKKRQGVRGGRVFMETTYWHDRDDNPENDHPFFNEWRATHPAVWNYGQLTLPGPDIRPRRLQPFMLRALLILLQRAKRQDFKVELVVDATLKHSPRVGWDVIGHCIRQTAVFCQHLDRGKWIGAEGTDGLGEGAMTAVNPKVTEQIQALFEEVSGPGLRDWLALETHNEWDAHANGAWADSYGTPDRAKALAEVNRQLDRMGNEKNGWPGCAFWVSHGGRDNIEYDGNLPTAIALHPSRHLDHDRAYEVGDRFRPLHRYGRPIYMNELMHGIDPSMWWTVDRGWFRRGSSDSHVRRGRWLLELLEAGYWACDHSLVGMAGGRWKDVDTDYSEMPLDNVERFLAEELGDGHDDRPPPPPDDDDDDDDADGGGDMVESNFDVAPTLERDDRRATVWRVPWQVVWGEKVEDQRSAVIKIPQADGRAIKGLRLFTGTNFADQGEVDIVIEDDGGPIASNGSPHKVFTDYDAYHKEIDFLDEWPMEVEGTLYIYFRARCTGPNRFFANDKPEDETYHRDGKKTWGMVIDLACVINWDLD